MPLSHTFAGQKSKSVFVEMSERSAESARLLQQARQAQPAQLPVQKRSLARWVAVRWDHLLHRTGKPIAPRAEEAGG